MGNIATIQSAIETAFSVLGDLVGTFTLRRETNVFDPLTSDYSSVVSTFVGEGVFDNEKTKFLPTTELSKGTSKVWLKITEEPLLSDILIFPDGTERTIVEVKPVRANATIFIYEVILGA